MTDAVGVWEYEKELNRSKVKVADISVFFLFHLLCFFPFVKSRQTSWWGHYLHL